MTDLFATLQALRAFLESQVAEAVPAELRSDVRAAAKTLGDLAAEIDALPALLGAEIDAMLNLQRLIERALASATAAGATAAAPAPAAATAATNLRFSQTLALHQQLRSDLSADLVAVQVRLRDAGLPDPARAGLTQVALRSYRLFEQQATARSAWQSIFDLANSKGSPPT